MSNEAWGFLGALVVAIITYLGSSLTTKSKLEELKLQQKNLNERLDLDKNKAEQDKRKTDADLSAQFLNIAEESGKQVISRDATIAEMQRVQEILRQQVISRDDAIKKMQASLEVLQRQVESLLVDKRKLEDDSIRKDGELNALRLENTSLRNRVQILEEAMKSAGVQIPNTGG